MLLYRLVPKMSTEHQVCLNVVNLAVYIFLFESGPAGRGCCRIGPVHVVALRRLELGYRFVRFSFVFICSFH